MTIKHCTKCDRRLPRSMFHKQAKAHDGLQSHCRDCRNGKKRKRTPADLEYLAQWREANPSKRKNRFLKYNFGITLDDWFELYDKQEGCCATCRKPCPRQPMRNGLQVDHCHSTGKIRGLLCGNCNRTLGLVHESRATLENMITYLEEH